MPQSRSAKKALRSSLTRRDRNKSVKARLATETKKFERAVERGDAAAARTQLSVVTKLLQQAAAKNVMKANTVARRQSRLGKELDKISGSSG